jgi:hypothetical protein
MRYVIACLTAAAFLGAIYLIDWGAQQAFAKKVRSLPGAPAEPDPNFQVEVPARIQTLIALDRFIFKNRFLLTALILMLSLTIAYYTGKAKSAEQRIGEIIA